MAKLLKFTNSTKDIDFLFDSTKVLSQINSSKQQYNNLVTYSIHDPADPDFAEIKQFLAQKSYKLPKTQKLSKALAIFLGNAVGDALGAHTEFLHIDPKQVIIEKGWEDLQKVKQRCEYGQITDDCSMARCLADSILVNNFKLDGFDLRYRFILWWHFGYNNTSKKTCSFGLGFNINQGFKQFYQDRTDFVSEKRGNVSGNGSIMRNSPVPIAFHGNLIEAMRFADQQSMTTHDGIEAAECCRYLTFLCVKLLNYSGQNPKEDIMVKGGEEFIKLNEENNFYPLSPGIIALVRSQQEQDISIYPEKYTKTSEDRYWNWQYPNIVLSQARLQDNPVYYGSYAMDAMYLALHIIYNTNNWREAIFRAVNLGGDSDSIASIVGQIGGAMYGIQDDVLALYEEKMQNFDEYTLFVKAFKLFKQKPVDAPKIKK